MRLGVGGDGFGTLKIDFMSIQDTTDEGEQDQTDQTSDE